MVQSSALRLVTVACEVGGRWNSQSRRLLRRLAAARARSAPEALKAQLRGAWCQRWIRLLSVAQQSSLAATLSEDTFPTLGGADGELPDAVQVWMDAAAAEAESAPAEDAGAEPAPAAKHRGNGA